MWLAGIGVAYQEWQMVFILCGWTDTSFAESCLAYMLSSSGGATMSIF